MKCYLIDPHTRTITETTIACGDELELRVLIGDGCRCAYMFAGSERPMLQDRDAIYTLDALEHDVYSLCHVSWQTEYKSRACCGGRAVILGHTEDGEPCSPTTPIGVVRNLFSFEDPRRA